MKKILIPGAMLISIAFASSAVAAGYGSGGCGVGALIFAGKNDKVSQVLASTTNGTFGNQTFGITTGTLNCDSTGLVVAQREIHIFTEKNFDSLAREMATGSGENLATLAGMMGYSAEELGTYTRGNYSKIFPSVKTTPTEMLSSLQEGLES